MDPVQVVPPSLDVGKVQTVVVVFPCQIPQNKLMTLELSYNQPSRKGAGWNCWVPGQPLGLESLLAKVPEIPYPGELDVTVKVSRQTFTLCPNFQLQVLSPLQRFLHSPSTVPKGGNSTSTATSLACLATYLLHTHEKDQSAHSHVDSVVCDVLKSQPTFGSEWNLSSLIFGKYGPKESLLHLFVRCKLEGATGMLLENLRGKETMLRQRDYRGRTPAEIAYKKGSKRIVEMLNEAIANSANSGHAEQSTEPRKQKSLQRQQLQGVFSSDEDIGPLPLHCTAKPSGMKKMMKKMRSKVSNDKRAGSTPHTPTRPHLTTHDSGPQQTNEPLQQLLSRKLYTASVLLDYHWEESPFGNDVSLKRGDIVYVIKDLGNGMCQGVCNDFYCTIPTCILANSDAEEKVYEPVSSDESSDGYEVVLDPYYIPKPSQVDPKPLQLPSIHTPPQVPVIERELKLQSMMTATNTQDTKLLPIPGRLLPDCKLSSSHDTGLDRLGMRQQATKGTPQSSQQQNQDASQSPQSLDPHIKGLAVNTAIRRVATPSESDEEEYDDATSFHQSANQRQSLQSEGYHAKTPRQPSCGDNPHTLTRIPAISKKPATPPPKYRVPTPPDSDSEEYADTTSLQQNLVSQGREIKPQRQINLIKKPPIKPHVSRATSFGGNQPSITPPPVKPRSMSHIIDSHMVQSSPTRARLKKEAPPTPKLDGSSTVMTELRRRLENK